MYQNITSSKLGLCRIVMVYEGGKSSCESVGDEDNNGSEESEDCFMMRSVCWFSKLKGWTVVVSDDRLL